jgi:hypothetical protein
MQQLCAAVRSYPHHFVLREEFHLLVDGTHRVGLALFTTLHCSQNTT